MPHGFLIVFSEPGSKVSLEEYQDWYNNEHVPLRLNHLKSFLNGVRYSSYNESEKPNWVAMYDIDDTATFEHESYTRLRANRSPREADLVKRLEVLDRRTCVLLDDTGESDKTSSFRPENPTQILVIQGVEVLAQDEAKSDQKFKEWSSETLLKMKGVDGWARTRSFKCYDNLIIGTAVEGKGPEAQKVPRYLAIHELLSPEVAETPAFKAATAEVDLEIMLSENRVWKLYRAYPCIAQGNLI